MSSCNEKLEFPRNSSGAKMQKISLVTSAKEVTSQKTFQHLLPLKSLKLAPIHSGELFSFVIKVAALETVRRFSKVRCPSLWKVVQAFQIFCYPPFKWLQRWGPLRIIVRGAQSIANPVLLLSIATTFSGNSENCRGATARVDDSQTQSDSVCGNSTFDIRSEESSKDITPESFKKDIPEGWQLQICGELEKQGISLPERFNEDELNRFYAAANGDLACLLSSLKKSIRWRESYNILSSQELEVWSHLVFWHGFDVMLRPCLVIRLGLACSTLAPDERPRFAQAVVSQIDHGVLNLIDENDSKITVLMDCEGLSPFKFPMNMMRSCSVLVQDHYPNRLGTLFILRLPPVVRVLAQTFIQVLKLTTRKKLRIVGEKNRKLLSEFLESVPAFLGGDCSCPRCRMLSSSRSPSTEETCRGEPSGNATNDDALAASSDFQATELPFSGSCEHLLRAAVVLILMLWVLIAFFAVTSESDSISFPL